ncbi:hypothetical protein PGTUg99_025141 [Puccinia graminis f. sp. tritici]|uniref:Uncharacterized protein n=1 Tax=Puccinia graminis f. sp. tritici TaxID=56615 RepID=A0A5B0R5N8_PUCGR|nr:hypothetical protein PGTUg99_025141 [Puccinia graminis f. sp. tritici]
MTTTAVTDKVFVAPERSSFIPGQSTQDGIDPAQIVGRQASQSGTTSVPKGPKIRRPNQPYGMTQRDQKINLGLAKLPEHTSNEPTLGHATNSLVGNGLEPTLPTDH